MADGVMAKDLQDYFDDARSWDADRAAKAASEKRLAYIIAIVAGVIAFLAILLYLLFPLRNVEPYVIRVDQRLGDVDVVSVADDVAAITSDEAVTKYFLTSYVRARETWVFDAKEELFREARFCRAVKNRMTCCASAARTIRKVQLISIRAVKPSESGSEISRLLTGA